MTGLRDLADPLDSLQQTDDKAASGLRDLGDPLESFTPEPLKTEVDQEKESDLLGAAVRGAKQTLAPFLLEREDFRGKRTLGEMATEAGVAMAGDVGMGAAIGSLLGPAGTAVGALAYPVAAALYRGMGYEYARSKAQGEDFDILRGGLNVVTEINPLISKGGRLWKAAAQAGLEAGREYAYSKDGGAAAMAGAMGGIFGAAFHREGPGWLAVLGQPVAKPTSISGAGVPKETVAGLQEMLAPDNPFAIALAEKVEKTDASYWKLSDDLFGKLTNKVDPEAMGPLQKIDKSTVYGPFTKEQKTGELFKDFILDSQGVKSSSDEATATWQHYLKTHSREKVDQAFAVFRGQQLAMETIEENNSRLARALQGDPTLGADEAAKAMKWKDPTSGGLADSFRDLKFQMRMIDDATGGTLNLEGAADAFSLAKNRTSVLMGPLLNKGDKLIRKGRKVGLDNETLGKWLAAEPGKEGLAPKLDEAQLEVAEGWRELFEEARQVLKSQGLEVDFIGTAVKSEVREDGWRRYLPMQAKKGNDMHKALRAELRRLESWGKGAGVTNPLATKEGEGLRRVVGHILGEDADNILYTAQVDEALKKALDPRYKSSTGYTASATFQRQPGAVIPEFARDFDVGGVFVNYLNTNLKAATYHDAILQMNANITALEAMGLGKSAKYLQRYVDDISGIPSDKMAARIKRINESTARLEEQIEGIVGTTALDKAHRNVLKFRQDIPRMVGFLTGQLYPNWLGWNVRAAIRNYMQPMLTTAPELGGTYGVGVVGKATAETASDFAKFKGNLAPWSDKSKFAKFSEFLAEHDLIQGQHYGEAMDLSSKSVRTQRFFGRALEGLEAHNNAAMWAYGFSDHVNRYITFKVGHSLARDFVRGVKPAEDYIRRVASSGNKTALRKILAQAGGEMGDDVVEKLGNELAAQLISKTQFNYGKESMNEFGREWGRLASMFTKWPVMIISDNEELLRKGGLGKGSLQILQRYGAPMIALAAAGQMLTDTKDSPGTAYLLGKSLHEASPIYSAKVSLPPVVQTLNKGVKAGLDFAPNMIKMISGEMEAGQAVKPAANFLRDTVMTYMPGMAVVNELGRANKQFQWVEDER